MAKWDVFLVRDFEHTFGVEEAEVRRMFAAGEIGQEDCVRPMGSDQWLRITTVPQFNAEAPPAIPADSDPPRSEPAEQDNDRTVSINSLAKRLTDDDSDLDDWEEPEPIPRISVTPTNNEVEPADQTPQVSEGNPAEEEPEDWQPLDWEEDDWDGETNPSDVGSPKPSLAERDETSEAMIAEPESTENDEDEEEPKFGHRRKRLGIEELDLTAMVDVTFLLILFFMLTATYTLQESIDVPAPDPEQKKAQQAIQNLDDLREDYIIVSINADNSLEVDGEPVQKEFSALVERIRRINRESSRNELVILADGAAYHETVVLVYDAANEVGMQRVRLAAEADEG